MVAKGISVKTYSVKEYSVKKYVCEVEQGGNVGNSKS